jgi:hypothetical protein
VEYHAAVNGDASTDSAASAAAELTPAGK